MARRLANKSWERRLTLEWLERRDVPSFVAPQMFPAGTSPSAIAGADFDNDGLNDVVVTNQTTPGMVNLLLNNGGGVFKAPKSFPAGGSQTSSVAVADYNGNGALDVAVSHSASGTVSILRGSGTGNFRRPVSYAAGPAPTSLTSADFNGDGAADIVVANRVDDGGVSVLINTGTGTFQPAQFYSVGTDVRSVATGDFNGDGDADLLAVGYEETCNISFCYTYNGKLAVFFGVGDGTFLAGPSLTATSPGDVMPGDFNGDGDLDIALAYTFVADDYTWYADKAIEVRLGNGDGTFGAGTIYNVGETPHAIDAEDLDGDGDVDLVVPVKGPLFSLIEHVKVLLNNGDGTFQSMPNYPVGAYPVAVAVLDYTGDGLTDIAVANNLENGVVTMLAGIGAGKFKNVPVYAVGAEPTALATGDYNGDGGTDLVVGDKAGSATLLLGSAGGAFQTGGSAFAGDPVAAASGDFNGDGNLDAAVLSIDDIYSNHSGKVIILPGDGVGGFPEIPSYPGTPGVNDALLADFNNDGLLDMAEAGGAGITVLLGTSGGGFGAGIYHNLVNAPYALATADFNGDGFMDIVTENRVMLGNGNGTFQSGATYAPNGYDAAVGDLNGDGFVDIASTRGPAVTISLGNGDGTVAAAVYNYGAASAPRDIALADFDVDGILDIVVTNSIEVGGSIAVLLGNGDGTFQDPISAPIGKWPVALDVGDLNGDGRLDVVVADQDPTYVSALLGNGDGTFQPKIDVNTAYGGHVTLADVNADGVLDLIVPHGAGSGPDEVSVLLGNGDGAFKPPVVYLAGPKPDDVMAADLNGDGDIDLTVAGRNFVTVLIGNGTGMFQAPMPLAAGIATAAIASTDFNGDGILDLAVASRVSAGTVNVFIGAASGGFAPFVSYSVGLHPQALAVFDFNSDGELDIATANGNGGNGDGVSVILGNGDGTFGSAIGSQAGVEPDSMAVADFNGDSILDIAVTDWDRHNNYGNSFIRVLIGNGDGSFQPPVSFTLYGIHKLIVAADFNGDGVSDLAVSNFLLGVVHVFLGVGDGTFQPMLNYILGNVPGVMVTSDFDGDGFADLAVNHKHGVAIVMNAADWPPLPIGDGGRTSLPLATWRPVTEVVASPSITISDDTAKSAEKPEEVVVRAEQKPIRWMGPLNRTASQADIQLANWIDAGFEVK